MLHSFNPMASPAEQSEAVRSWGLKRNTLSPFETLAQSVSSVAPTAGPTVLIPLVFASAGTGTWFAYLLATLAMLLVALNITTFAAHSPSPGSLYSYSTSVLTGPFGQLSAWGLLLAYVATAAAVTGGFIAYSNVLLKSVFGVQLPPIVLTVIAIGTATWIAWRDVKISARMMLWFEAASVALISVVIGLTLWKTGLHVDREQFTLAGTTPGGIRLGMVLAIFSFVGFESATTLGEEARNPLRTVPAAVILSALLAGLFFMFCAYAEVLGFKQAHQDLGQSTAPLQVLADRAGLSVLSPFIALGAVTSFFACCLSCITAAARVALRMAHDGLMHGHLRRVHHINDTPGNAAIVAGAAAFVPASILALRGVSGFDINGWMGTLATYGFIVAYLLVSVAAPIHRRRQGKLSLRGVLVSVVSTLALLLAAVGSVYPIPPSPYPWLIALFAAVLVAGFLWSLAANRQVAIESAGAD